MGEAEAAHAGDAGRNAATRMATVGWSFVRHVIRNASNTKRFEFPRIPQRIPPQCPFRFETATRR